MNQDEKVKTWAPVLFGFTLLVGFLILTFRLAFYSTPASNLQIIEGMIQLLGAAITTMVGYWFGSSAGSAKKTELMSDTSIKEAAKVPVTIPPTDPNVPITPQPKGNQP